MQKQKQTGFTIVELLIVVIVIAILAAITIVAYNGVVRNTQISLVKDTLAKSGTVMKMVNVEDGVFPTAFPEGKIQVPDAVGLALTVVDESTNFCINGTHADIDTIAFHISQDSTPEEGLCEGAVIQESIIGQYNENAYMPGQEIPEQVVTSVRTVTSTGGFKLVTDDAWSQITLSWDAVPSATKYEVQVRAEGGTWYYRSISNGAGAVGISSTSTAYSGVIAPTTTSLTWTGGIPQVPGAKNEYRMRATVANVDGEWNDLSLATPETDSIPAIQSFNISPDSGWASVNFSWSAPQGFNSPANIVYQLQARIPNGTWYNRSISNGAGAVGISSTSTAYSGAIPVNTTSLTWTGGIPQTAEAVYEYRIRAISTVASAIYGPWVTKSLSVTQNTLPAVANFSVTPDSSWSSINLNWTQPPGFESLSNVVYQLQARSAGGTWYYRSISNGAGAVGVPNTSTAYSGMIPSNITLLTWVGAIPQSTGAVYEYRIRTGSSVASGVYGPWTDFTLTRQ